MYTRKMYFSKPRKTKFQILFIFCWLKINKYKYIFFCFISKKKNKTKCIGTEVLQEYKLHNKKTLLCILYALYVLPISVPMYIHLYIYKSMLHINTSNNNNNKTKIGIFTTYDTLHPTSSLFKSLSAYLLYSVVNSLNV